MHLKKLLTVLLVFCGKVYADSPAPLPSSAEMTHSYESSFIRMILVLVGIIFLVFATLWVLKRVGGGKFKLGGSTQSIDIIERRPLSPKTMLYVVDVEGKRIVISESQLEVRALTDLKEPHGE